MFQRHCRSSHVSQKLLFLLHNIKQNTNPLSSPVHLGKWTRLPVLGHGEAESGPLQSLILQAALALQGWRKGGRVIAGSLILQSGFRSSFPAWSEQWPSLPVIITEDSFFPKLCFRYLLLSLKKDGGDEGGEKESGERKIGKERKKEKKKGEIKRDERGEKRGVSV